MFLSSIKTFRERKKVTNRQKDIARFNKQFSLGRNQTLLVKAQTETLHCSMVWTFPFMTFPQMLCCLLDLFSKYSIPPLAFSTKIYNLLGPFTKTNYDLPSLICKLLPPPSIAKKPEGGKTFSKHRPSGPMLCISLNVHMFVCLSVHFWGTV